MDINPVVRRMLRGANGPLLSFGALFLLPLFGALVLDADNFAFWSLLASISTIALSVDFGGSALLTAQYYSLGRSRNLVRSSILSISGALGVGVVAAVAWSAIQPRSFSESIPLIEGLIAIGVMSVSACIRSILMVIAQAALMESWFRLRNISTAGHAAVALLISLILLWVNKSFWALPLGWAISGGIILPLCLILLKKGAKGKPHRMDFASSVVLWRFISVRTVNTVVASSILQGDRWFIALIAGPQWLALYEIAWRFATLPRILMQALSLHVGADVAAMKSDQVHQMLDVVWRSTRYVALAGFMGSILMAGFYVVFSNLNDSSPSLGMFALLAVAFGLLALPAPFSHAAVAVGRAGIDLPYNAFALVGLIVSGVLGVILGDASVFVLGYSLSLCAAVPVFFLYAPKATLESFRKRR